MFLSETLEDIDLVIPFDTVDIGKKQRQFFDSYNPDLLFHKSSLPTLVQSDIYSLLQRPKEVHDMSDLVHKLLYQGSSVNIVTPQLQVPIQCQEPTKFLKDLPKE